jgi:hypothetical protein
MCAIEIVVSVSNSIKKNSMNSKRIKFLLLTILTLTVASSFGQSVRGFYVTGIDTWLGNTTKENDILNYAKGNGYNYIALYSLNAIQWNGVAHKNRIANFIKKAKTQYNIVQVGAVLETYDFLRDNIIPYNNGRQNANEKFDVINQEFEFWITASIVNQYAQKYLIPNGYSVDSAGAFAFSYKELKKIDSACATNNLISEVYVGWPNRGQMQKIASKADRILVHAYRPDDVDVYAFSKQRLKDIASAAGHKKVIAIFSAEPVFMGPWLNTNPLIKAYQSYADDFATEVDTFKQDIELLGYQWFTYGYMPKTVMPNAFITANGPVNFCPGGSVQLTANSGSAYRWIPGGQTTRTINVSNPDIYKVIVTNSSGDRDTSAAVSVEYATGSGIPTITALGSTNICSGDQVTLTASNSSGYIWSNGAHTRSITVSSAGNYTVTTGGSCPATSLPFHIDVITPPVATVTAHGPLSICQGTTVTLTSSQANGYIWSNGATTQSITVNATGNYHVNTYATANCSSQSSNVHVTVKAKPAKPLISTIGSSIITLSNPSVTLNSTHGTTYQWTTGNTSSSITVNQPGNYAVEVTGSNGCMNLSDQFAVTSEACSPPNVPAIRLSSDSVIIDGDPIPLSSTEGDGYLWSTGETTQSILVDKPGSYQVRVYNNSDCSTASMPVTIRDSVTNRISDATAHAEELNTYPNPATDAFTVQFNSTSEKTYQYNLIDASGKTVLHMELSAVEGQNTFNFDVSMLPRGIFYSAIESENIRNVGKVILK